MIKKLILGFLLSYSLLTFAQDPKTYQHFNNTRIINLQSVELLAPGIMELKISHRFGAVTEGPANFFGLDNATMRIAFEQGISKNLMLGVGRSTFQKTFDAFVKWKIIQQKEKGTPFTMCFLSTINLNGMPFDKSRTNFFSSRLSYIHQLIFSSKINTQWTFQVSPTFIHKNLVTYANDKNDNFALGLAGSYKISKNISLNLEYIARIKRGEITPSYSDYYNSFSAGLGIETKGHFFELHLTNSMPMNETSFILETTDSWLKGNIHPGFNLIRDFKLYKKR